MMSPDVVGAAANASEPRPTTPINIATLLHPQVL
jgi:hypothetical protein